MTTKKIWGIVPAAGVGARMHVDAAKQYLPLAGRPVLAHALQTICDCDAVAGAVVGIRRDDTCWAEMKFSHGKLLGVSEGGEVRAATVLNALRWLRAEADAASEDWAMVHDGVRPCLRGEDVARLIAAARENGKGAVLATRVQDALKVEGASGLEAAPRATYWRTQTPQMFRLGALEAALEAAVQAAAETGLQPRDEAEAMAAAGVQPAAVEGHADNLKITVPGDLQRAEFILRGREGAGETRIGCGFDAHRLVAGRRLVLGGVTIDWHAGLAGHSDGDALLHAVCDACLGAAGLGDIGVHFPSTDARYAGADSREFVRQVRTMLAAAGWRVGNLDATIIAEKPKLAGYLSAMRDNLAADLAAPAAAVSVKATTTDGLGFCGREEGIAAQATALLIRP